MKPIILTFLTLLFWVDLNAQSDNIAYLHFFKADSTYIMVDNTKDHWYTLQFNADTLIQDEDNRIIYDNMKLLQLNVIPFSEILPNQTKPISVQKALQKYKKWEIDFQQKELGAKLKSGEELYYRDQKPFLIWWYKNPPDSDTDILVDNGQEYDFEKGTFVDVITLNVTYMLCLNFSIYGKKNVAFTIPVFENENLEDEIENLKKIANSLRVYGGNIDLDVLMDIKKYKKKYILHDYQEYLELEVPDWANVIKPHYETMLGVTFPEYHEVVNAMILHWEYKSDSLTFNDFINLSKVPHEERANYRLIEKNDSTYKYFYTSDNGWFHQQCVYLKGDNIYCLINFTATKNTYDYNIGRFDEIVKKIKIK